MGDHGEYIKNIKGDLFIFQRKKIRCHQVNCRGVMGAGIAKQVKDKYPEAFEQYKALCDQFGSSLLGHTQFVVCHDGTIIANMFAQDDYNSSKPQTNMTAFDECLSQVAQFAFRVNATVGFPKLIGCGLGGGNWDEVYALIANYFDFLSARNCTIVEWDGGLTSGTIELEKKDDPESHMPAKDGQKRMKVTIYTDGSCLGNPGPGGWGAILMAEVNGKKTVKEIHGHEQDTTNNRMEISAVIHALSSLKLPCEVKLYTDSSYVVNSVTKGWMESWKKNGWKKKGGLANVELWQKIDQLLQVHDVTFFWVKGHADNPNNNRCDEMAQQEARSIA